MARDTAQDWEKIGAEEPWYGVLSAPEFLAANLTEEAKERFYAQGVSEMSAVVDILRSKFGPFSPDIGADFGSGLGRLAQPMSRICRHVYGLDVAQAMRAEAIVQARQRSINNIEFLPELPSQARVDWINSYIVFQHILPRTGYQILEGLLSSLNTGGHVSIQLTCTHDRRTLVNLERDVTAWRFDGETMTVLQEAPYGTGEMSMYDYDMNRVLWLFTSAGIRDLHLQKTDHGGVHGFWIFGRKTV